MAFDDQEIVFRLSAKNLTKEDFDKARKSLLGVGDGAKQANQKLSPLGQEVQRVTKRFAEMNPVTGSVSRAFGGASVAALGGAAAVGALAVAIGAGIRSTIALGEELTTLRDKTGIGLAGLQELKFVAEQTNVPFDRVTDAVVRLGRRSASELPEAVKGLDRIGLSIQDILSKRPEEGFRLVLNEIAKLPTEAERSARSMEIFGDAGLQILPLLKADIDALQEEFEDLGGAIDDETVEAGRRLSDNITSLTKIMKDAVVEGASPFTKALADMTSGMIDFLKVSNEDRLRDSFEIGQIVQQQGVNPSQARKILEERRAAAKEREEDVRRAIEIENELAAAAEKNFRRSSQGIRQQIGDLLENKKAQEELAKTAKFLGISTKELTALAEENGRAFIESADAMRVADEQAKELEKLNKELAKSAQSWRDANSAMLNFFKNAAGRPDVSLTPTVFAPTIEDIGPGRFSDITLERPGLGSDNETLADEIERAEKAQEEYNEALQAANALANILGGTLGSIVAQTLSAAAALQNLSALGGEGGILGGLKNAFSTGKGDAGGIVGLLGGIGSLVSTAAPIIGIGVSMGKAIFKGLSSFIGRNAGDVAKEVARDLGAEVSKELAKEIAKSGKPVQLAVGQIFREGGFKNDIGRFAEEIGDLFSLRAGGRISEEELLGALNDSIPDLIANFEKLGPEGQEQVERIIAAAREMGIEFEGLTDLIGLSLTEEALEEMGLAGETNVHRIREAAAELGIEFDVLKEKIDATFAPETLESIAETFGLTNDEVRALGEELGINIQTNLERMAAELGLTADEFNALGAALEEKFGIPAEQLAEFLKATGLSAAELAEKLGVDVGEGAEAVADAQDLANQRLEEGGELASFMADEIERAARASNAINVGGGGGPGFAEGTPNADFLDFGSGTNVTLHGSEAVIPEGGAGRLASEIARALGGVGGGNTLNASTVINIAEPLASMEDIKRAVVPAINQALEDNFAGIQDRVRR